MCHICSGGRAKHMAVSAGAGGYVAPSNGVSCPGLQLGLQSLWGWQVTRGATAPSRKVRTHKYSTPRCQPPEDVTQRHSAAWVVRTPSAPASPFPRLWWPQGLLEIPERRPGTAGAVFLLLLSSGPARTPPVPQEGRDGGRPHPSRWCWTELTVGLSTSRDIPPLRRGAPARRS